MKKILVLAQLLAPAFTLGASDYTKNVKPGGGVKVCAATLSELAIVSEDGETIAAVGTTERKPGKCVRIKVPKGTPPGTYTLETYEPTYSGCGTWSTNCKTTKNTRREIGTIEVVPKKPKN